jgi:multiple sugar transport system ATP-binding protein
MSQLALKSLSKSFGTFKVFDGLDLEAAPGEIVVVFGGSGTGKTILLRLIAGVEEPTAGKIELEGLDMTDVPPESRNVGMAFQNFALFPHMSARENIAAPMNARSAAAAVRDAAVDKVARLLKIEHVMGHAPRELSNGQKQRTSLARALVASPKILLLDDPLRNVDAKLRYEMRLELPRLLRQSGATVLYVTQDYKEAMALGDRIAVLHNGQFAQLATPADIYERPASLQIARLFGDPVINTVETVVKGGQVDIAGYPVAINKAAGIEGRAVVVGFRPDAVTVAKGKGGLAAQLMAVTPLNERNVLLLQANNGFEVLASLPASAALPDSNSNVSLTVKSGDLHLFDKDTGARLNG